MKWFCHFAIWFANFAIDRDASFQKIFKNINMHKKSEICKNMRTKVHDNNLSIKLIFDLILYAYFVVPISGKIGFCITIATLRILADIEKYRCKPFSFSYSASFSNEARLALRAWHFSKAFCMVRPFSSLNS